MNPSDKILTSDGTGDGPEVAAAADALARGCLVAFPTETVYAFASRADSDEALDRLAVAKERPAERPFARLIADIDDVEQYVEHVSDNADTLMRHFWPGPMTLVMTARNGDSIGLRLPDHALARAICRAATGGVAATSVNLSGEPPLNDAAAIAERFGDRLELIIDDPSTASGRASTVLRIDDDGWDLLREGEVSVEEISALIGEPRKQN